MKTHSEILTVIEPGTPIPFHVQVLRYDHIARMLENISVKHEGKVAWAFIVYVTPRLAGMDAAAVDATLAELLAQDHVELCYGAVYQGVRKYLVEHGMPELDPEASRSGADHPGSDWHDLELVTTRVQ